MTYCVLVGCDNDEQCRTGEHCVIEDICRAPAAVGPCDAAFPRWFHNYETGRCEQFTWGGCGGNDNNFESKDQCEATCVGVPVPKLSIAARAGTCEPDVPPNNCPDEGCPDGSYCGLCWIGYECIPDGAVC